MSIGSLKDTITLLGRIADTHAAVVPIYPETSEKPPCRITPIRQPFPRASPEEVGLSSGAVADFLTALKEDETLNMHSVLILRRGKLIAEAVFGDQDTRIWKTTFSAAKSITALAMGFLYDEGKLRPEEKLADTLSAYMPPLFRHAKELTVRHLLTMSTGASFNEAEMMGERDWRRGFFGGTFDVGPFSYNSLNTYMLSAILFEKTGENLSEYLRPRLFDPLGIENVWWEKCPYGIEKGGWGFYIRPEDMAKIGQLVLDGGVWHGERLVSEKWLALSTSRQISTGAVSALYDYGFQTWVGRRTNSFLFNGMLGQNVIGFRDSGVLLVSNAGNSEMFQGSHYFTLAEEYFDAPRAASAEGAEEAKRLAAVLDALREKPPRAPAPAESAKPKGLSALFHRTATPPAPAAPALPAPCARLSGMRFVPDDENAPSAGLFPVLLQAVQNNYASGLVSLSFLTSGASFYMTYEEKTERHVVRIGFGYPADNELSFGGIPYHVRVLGRFTADEDERPLLKLRFTFSETPLTRTLKFYYTGRRLRLEQAEWPGAPFVLDQALMIKNALCAVPLIGTAAGRVDNDYLRYRVEKKFAPALTMRPDTPGQAAPEAAPRGIHGTI